MSQQQNSLGQQKYLKNSILKGPYVPKEITDPGNSEHNIPPFKRQPRDDELSDIINDHEREGIELSRIAQNTKFLNSLQPEWKRYVTIVTQTKDLNKISYDDLYEILKENEEESIEFRIEKAYKNHDLLVLVAHTYNSPQHQYAPQPPYVQQHNYSPQPYYVTYPSSSNMTNDIRENHEYDFQVEKDNDDPVANLNKAMMLLARAFT
ncbi:hypothetical protein Tco_0456372 [Tanacetum coccineum]